MKDGFWIIEMFQYEGSSEHRLHYAEQDANSRAFTYFNKHVENYNAYRNDWNETKNPIVGYDFSKSYNDIVNQMALSNNLTHLKWYDFGLLPTTDLLISGIANQYINK